MNIYTDEEVIKKRDDLEMMRRPHLWPHDRLLPLKHRSEKRDGWPREAVLFAGSKGYILLMDANILALDNVELSQGREGGDEMLQELVKDGWIVD
jgi:hypothetical protein